MTKNKTFELRRRRAIVFWFFVSLVNAIFFAGVLECVWSSSFGWAME